MKEKIAEFIKDKLLTPVIYMSREIDLTLVFGFFDNSITEEMLYAKQHELSEAVGEKISIIDFRSCDAFERFDIITHAELIYKESEFVKAMFETAMVQDYSVVQGEREALLRRMDKYGTPSLS